MDTYLRCRVSCGLFTGEAAVRGAAFDGTEFSLFLPEEYVEYDAPLTGRGIVDGWMRVDVIDSRGPLLLVRLPAETFENGRTITVARSQVQDRESRQHTGGPA
jgi:hypothetical protein